MRGDLYKLNPAQEPLTRLDGQYPAYAQARLALLQNHGCRFLSIDPDDTRDEQQRLSALIEAIRRIGQSVAAGLRVTRVGALWQFDFLPAGLTLQWDECNLRLAAHRSQDQGLVDWLMSLAPPESTLTQQATKLLAYAWALSMQEDFVLLRGRADPAGRGQQLLAEALLVSFPSGWQPYDKLGLSFSQIHLPVADSDDLQRASSRLSQALLHKGPFQRHVWTLTDTPRLDRPALPARKGSDPAESAESAQALHSIWFRCERQTTLALPAQNRALFLIRTYVAPLLEAASGIERRAALVNALRSMSDEVVRYKNLGEPRERVLTAWG